MTKNAIQNSMKEKIIKVLVLAVFHFKTSGSVADANFTRHQNYERNKTRAKLVEKQRESFSLQVYVEK